MGPETNSELFSHIKPHDGLEGRLDEEVTRRAMLAGTLRDLSDAFVHADAAKHQVTEPLLALSLAALAQVQTSRMGVTGSNPIGAIDRGYAALRVHAHAAPSHDSYHSHAVGEKILTRAIKILPHENGGFNDGVGGPNVEFFGLNMYIADIGNADSDPSALLSDEGTAESTPALGGLVIVSKGGTIATTRSSHIAGETPILAVRNTDTQDAKVYSATLVTESALEGVQLGVPLEVAANRGPIFVGDDKAFISVPGGRFIQITVLRDQLALQAASEFTAATDTIKQRDHPTLSAEERIAVSDVYDK